MIVGADVLDLETARGCLDAEDQIQELTRRFINMVKYGRTERMARS